MQLSLHQLLFRANHRQQNTLQPVRDELGLGRGQPKILTYLNTHGPSTQSDISEYFSIDPASVSRMTEILRQNGFLSRTPVEDCRRANRLELTEKGVKAAEKWAENPKDTPIEGSGDNAKYSSKHYAEWAEYWFEQAQAAVNLSPGSDTVAGINKNYSSFGNNTDGSVNQQVLTAKFTEIEEEIEAAAPVYMTYEETMAILNEEVTV